MKETHLAQDWLEAVVPNLPCKLLNLNSHTTKLPTEKVIKL